MEALNKSSFTFAQNLVVILLVVNLAARIGSATSTNKLTTPNIIVIYTDDQGYGDATCLNKDSKFLTPNIDRLASEGVLFTDGHCSDTVCTPSRYGLLTGRYSWRTELKRGVFQAERKCLIPDQRMTVASFLRDNGYQTAMVGKWHLGMDFPGTRTMRDWSQPVLDMPLDKGFGYFWGIPASMNYGVLAWFEGRFAKVPPTEYTTKKQNKIALDDYRIMPPYDRSASIENASPTGNFSGKLEVAPDFIDISCLDRFTTQSIEWMKQRNTDKPFFLYLPYTSPHKPVIPMDRFRGQGEAGAYGEFMIETDWHVGRILDFLETEGLDDNTFILFTSDNGPETTWKKRKELFQHASNGPYREGKRSIYEGGHRVPFIVRWPAGIVSPGRIYASPVCQTDLLATLADIVGESLPNDAGEDSQSFLPALTQSTMVDRVPMIHHSSRGEFAIRENQWKLVMGSTKKRKQELYNLSNDPGEKHNLFDTQRERAKTLQQKLTHIVRSGRSTQGNPVSNDTSYWDDLFWMTEAEYRQPDQAIQSVEKKTKIHRLASTRRSVFDAFVYINRLPEVPYEDESSVEFSGRIFGRLANQEGRILLKSPPGMSTLAYEGFKTFIQYEGDQRVGNCAACHTLPDFTDGRSHSVQPRMVKVPTTSLRNMNKSSQALRAIINQKIEYAKIKQKGDAPKTSDLYSTIRLDQNDVSALVAFIKLLHDVPEQMFRQLILDSEVFDPSNTPE